MANDLSAVMPKILARGLLALRERAVMPRLVNGDYSEDAKERGDTIDVPIPTAVTVIDVTPSNTPPAGVDTTPTKVQVQLNNWKQNQPFYLSDKDMVEVDKNKHFLPMQMDEAINALAVSVNTDIHNEYLGVYGYYGTAGTTPFGSGVGVKSATQGRKVLNQQKCPKNNRRGVLDFDAEAAALELDAFSDADKVGSALVKMEGEVGRKFGVDWVADDNVITHTAGVPGGTPLVNGAHTAADTTIAMDGGGAAGTYLIGDIITFAGHTQTYVITANTTLDGSGVGILPIDPPLQANVADNAAITLKATHVVNMIFHRDAFAFAMRPLTEESAGMDLGPKIISAQDPVTGLVMRLEVSRQHKRVAWEFDILWGAKLVRPELAMRLVG